MPNVYYLPTSGVPSLEPVTIDVDKQVNQLRKLIGGGYLEEVKLMPAFIEGILISPGKTYSFFVDEEGEVKGLPENRYFPTFLGDVLLVATNAAGEVVDISEDHCKQIIANGKQIWGR